MKTKASIDKAVRAMCRAAIFTSMLNMVAISSLSQGFAEPTEWTETENWAASFMEISNSHSIFLIHELVSEANSVMEDENQNLMIVSTTDLSEADFEMAFSEMPDLHRGAQVIQETEMKDLEIANGKSASYKLKVGATEFNLTQIVYETVCGENEIVRIYSKNNTSSFSTDKDEFVAKLIVKNQEDYALDCDTPPSQR